MSLRSLSVLVPILLVACGGSAVTPTPEPTPTPTPVPAPTPTPRISACGVGPGEGDGEDCPRTDPSFLPDVDDAINRVVAKHPGLFDLDDARGNGGYFVKDRDEYFRQVVAELEAAEICARVDGGNEIAVKKTNDFNDQYHIMISSGHIRRGIASYRSTCAPAWF